MNVIQEGNRLLVFGNEVKTHKSIPAGVYSLAFTKQSGFFLEVEPEVHVNCKIYGDNMRRVNKVVHAYQTSDRNVGVIFSGLRGQGKSLSAALIMEQMVKAGVPVILVNEYYPGYADYLEDLGDCCIIIDEIEKKFVKDKESNFDPMSPLLTVVDGLNKNSHKLFLIIANEANLLNDYFKNRPGRFRYSFNFGVPTDEEIREYMLDNLLPEHYNLIPRIINFAHITEFSYDILRAIMEEVNNGYSLTETMSDLNVEMALRARFDVEISAGAYQFKAFSQWLDFTTDYGTNLWLTPFGAEKEDKKMQVQFKFNNSDITVINDQLAVNPERVEIFVDEDDFDDTEEGKHLLARAKNLKVNSLVLHKTMTTQNTKILV